MKKINFTKIAKEVIETEIQSLKKLKKNIKNSFNQSSSDAILNCKKGKVIIYVVLENQELLQKKLHLLYLQLEHHHFLFDASACSHGDLGKLVLMMFLF